MFFEDGIRVYGTDVSGTPQLQNQSKQVDTDGIRVYAENPETITNTTENDGIRIYTTKKFQKFLVDPQSINKPASQVYDVSSAIIIRNSLRRAFKTRDKIKILNFRNHTDLYTGLPCDTSKKLSVDHIFEVQCMSHVIAKVSIGRDASWLDALLPEIKKALNINENLNVTTLSLNCSKMNAFKWLLHDDMYGAYPLEAYLNETKCSKFILNIQQALMVAYQSVRETISRLKSNKLFKHQISAIDELLNEMDVMVQKFKL